MGMHNRRLIERHHLEYRQASSETAFLHAGRLFQIKKSASTGAAYTHVHSANEQPPAVCSQRNTSGPVQLHQWDTIEKAAYGAGRAGLGLGDWRRAWRECRGEER